MIPEPIRIDELPLELKVNRISVRSVQIRSVPASDDFQILMTDPQLGRFSLTSAFELEMREEGSSWRTVTLEQLTKNSYREQRILARRKIYQRPRRWPSAGFLTDSMTSIFHTAIHGEWPKLPVTIDA